MIALFFGHRVCPRGRGVTPHLRGVRKLIMNALVMYDHQTRTFWSQFLGKGVRGTLAGVELDSLPVTQTQWSLWREAHPDTLALNKGGRYRFDTYDSYYRGGAAQGCWARPVPMTGWTARRWW
ncbi:MAG: DUF3179 domain-containing (seleno)protein [SAR202 cluster bacterium]|nr:DUF3179 domain-containing (seleno)protein [SAR202 cluster bacterium]